MLDFYVSVKVVFGGKLLAALFALEGLVSCVDPLVGVSVHPQDEPLAANGTRPFPLFFFFDTSAFLRGHVSFQVTIVKESVAAHRTDPRSFLVRGFFHLRKVIRRTP